MTGKLARAVPLEVARLLELNNIPNIAALAERIGREHTKAHVYRVLLGELKHKQLLTLLRLSRAFALVNKDGLTDIDMLSKYLLDVNKAQSRNWIREQMIKNQITSIKRLAVRAGIPYSLAHSFESGEQQYIQLRIYRDIARGLNTNLCKLLTILLAGTQEYELLQPVTDVANLVSQKPIDIYFCQ